MARIQHQRYRRARLVAARAQRILNQRLTASRARLDRLFAWLLAVQAIVVLMAMLGPWRDISEPFGRQLLVCGVAMALAGAVPGCLAWRWPGRAVTRQTIAAAQMIWSALLIHALGGKLETHFHTFASLAILAAYRDPRVLLTAMLVTGADHAARGWFWPESIYGVDLVDYFRVLEQGIWFVLEGGLLALLIGRELDQARTLARSQAELEDSHQRLQIEYEERARRDRRYSEQAEADREELMRQTEQLSQACQAAGAASAAKGRFLTMISHEIRTPMTAILGYADMLIAGLVGKPEQTAAETIKRNGEFLLKVVNEVLDISAIEAGKLSIERVRCSPHQMVFDVTQLLRVRADAKGLRMNVEFRGQMPATVLTDSIRLRQILLNLVGNSIKFSLQGEIGISVCLEHDTQQGPRLRFDISDQGIGMSPEQLSTLFRPYAQADPTTARRFGGSGLGLAISKSLAELLGGTIEVQSTLGEGSQFSLWIAAGSLEGVPLLPESLNRAAAERAERSQSDRSNSDPSAGPRVERLDCRVLLADDSPDNQELVTFVLEKVGARVQVVGNGAEAVSQALTAFAAGKPFDLILMDVQMPLVDGVEATEQLRMHGYPGPIIALTAHALHDELERCLLAGCDACLTKPIDGRLLDLVARYVHSTDPVVTSAV